MLCQNCHRNEATIHLYMSVNGQRQQVDLCQNCYQLLKQQQSNDSGNGGGRMAQDPFGFGNLDDIFRAMQGGQGSPNDYRQAAAQNNQPTQPAGNQGSGNNGLLNQ